MTRNVYLLHAIVEVKALRRPRERHYSGKLVKRLILAANPGLEEVFSPSRGAAPKIVHITPLYQQQDSRVKTVRYSDEVSNGSYHFYFGAVDPYIDKYEAINTLNAIPPAVEFASGLYRIEHIEVNEENVYEHADKTINNLQRRGKFKLVFASPTILRDPLVSSKHKTLVPSVMNIFSTPVYIRLYLSGKLRLRTFMKTLLRLHRALSVPPTFWQTLRKIDLHYEPGRRVPALIGYINLYYNPENDPEGIAMDILQEMLPYMLALGTGVGRATGLGHVTLY